MTEAIARAVAGRVFAIVALACLSTVSPAGAGTITYGYDALGRVVSATFSNGVVATYQYDAAGNRTLFSTTAAPAPAPVAGAVSATVAYNSANNSITSKLSGGAATSVAPSPAPHGAVTVSGLNFLYAPTNGYFGADNFTYTASNSGGTSAPATVSITRARGPSCAVDAHIACSTVWFSSNG